MTKRRIPQRIICLTEESVETLALLGRLDLVVGTSVFVKRPREAQNLPKVSAFTGANLEKIVTLKPDLVLGFSDIQKEIARDLVGAGLNVWIANHRTLDETLDYVLMLGRLVGEEQKAQSLIDTWQAEMAQLVELNQSKTHRPKVYFEEWDEPQISAIRWVSELIELAGGQDIFSSRSREKMAQGRVCTPSEVIACDPDIIFACWCGKRVRLDDLRRRPGWEVISAVRTNQLFELPPEIFLQPGPALFVDGVRLLRQYLEKLP